ncbi:hypothetical protein Ahy_A01g003807 isoform A [Arachis hypogaea]|uniref:Uncharacterized protein n=1 Tax=Arachis hypogaea TaxID=3818 RepID=A0A445ETY7_ARAHY|nr:hypothetical protein Ahy_A01g003807 isoform A [Arachis hypogaea]
MARKIDKFRVKIMGEIREIRVLITTDALGVEFCLFCEFWWGRHRVRLLQSKEQRSHYHTRISLQIGLPYLEAVLADNSPNPPRCSMRVTLLFRAIISLVSLECRSPDWFSIPWWQNGEGFKVLPILLAWNWTHGSLIGCVVCTHGEPVVCIFFEPSILRVGLSEGLIVKVDSHTDVGCIGLVVLVQEVQRHWVQKKGLSLNKQCVLVADLLE